MNWTKSLGAAALAAALAACGGSGGSGDTTTTHVATALETALQGTWTRCLTHGGVDYKETRVVSGSSVARSVNSYTTTNASCGAGAAAVPGDPGGPYSVGSTTAATIGTGGTAVTATKVDYSGVMFDIAYVVTTANPAEWYVGDDAATPGLDRTTAAKRPTVLELQPFLKQ
jgi:hypothetical protein